MTEGGKERDGLYLDDLISALTNHFAATTHSPVFTRLLRQLTNIEMGREISE
jgi:hypothetical protein